MTTTCTVRSYFKACQDREDMDTALFQKVWDRALETHQIVLDGPFLDQTQSLNITKALKNTIKYYGKGIHSDFPSLNQKAHGIARFLFGQTDTIHIGCEEFSALAVRQNPSLMHELRCEIRSCLRSIPKPSNEEEAINTQAFITSLTSLIPFTYPEAGSPFPIPIMENDWEIAEYQVEKVIELTPQAFGSPIPAYLLTSKQGPPHLIFIGTTYPAGRGAAGTFCGDCTPGMSVAHAPILWGLDELKEALGLEKPDGYRDIVMSGVSHGGASQLQFLRKLPPEQQARFKRLEVARPALLYWWDWSQEFDRGPKINIYIQPNDIVSRMGIFPTGKNVRVYEVHRGKTGEPEDTLRSHLRPNNGADWVTILQLDPRILNSEKGRIALTLFHIIVSPIFYFVGSIIALLSKLFYCIFALLETILPV